MWVWHHSFCPSYHPQNGYFTTVKGQTFYNSADSCTYIFHFNDGDQMNSCVDIFLNKMSKTSHNHTLNTIFMATTICALIITVHKFFQIEGNT